MKIRDGFVSNSSSSSFIIALEELPNQPDDILKIFNGQEYRFSDRAIKQIYNDIKKAKPLNEDELLDSFCGGYIYDYNIPNINLDDYEKYRQPKPDNKYYFDWESYEKDKKEIRSKALEKFKKKNPNAKYFFEISYSDNNGDFGSYMEHDLPWHDSKRVQVISNH